MSPPNKSFELQFKAAKWVAVQLIQFFCYYLVVTKITADDGTLYDYFVIYVEANAVAEVTKFIWRTIKQRSKTPPNTQNDSG